MLSLHIPSGRSAPNNSYVFHLLKIIKKTFFSYIKNDFYGDFIAIYRLKPNKTYLDKDLK